MEYFRQDANFPKFPEFLKRLMFLVFLREIVHTLINIPLKSVGLFKLVETSFNHETRIICIFG